jgi:hypothetical protein
MPAKKESSKLRVQLLFKWWESALALAKDDHAERASFSRASSKKEIRFESSKLGSHQGTNNKF